MSSSRSSGLSAPSELPEFRAALFFRSRKLRLLYQTESVTLEVRERGTDELSRGYVCSRRLRKLRRARLRFNSAAGTPPGFHQLLFRCLMPRLSSRHWGNKRLSQDRLTSMLGRPFQSHVHSTPFSRTCSYSPASAPFDIRLPLPRGCGIPGVASLFFSCRLSPRASSHHWTPQDLKNIVMLDCRRLAR